MKVTWMAVGLVCLAASASAQVVVHEQSSKAATEQHLQVLLEKAPATGYTVSFEAKPITGAPYSGEAVTETVQVLADGNRIVKKNSVRVYRDGKGRTRKETLGSDGQVTTVSISDPTGGKSVMFDPSGNTARSSGVATFVVSGEPHASTGAATGGTVVGYSTEKEQKEAQIKMLREMSVTTHISTGEAGVAGAATKVAAGYLIADPNAKAATKEDLGQQSFDGVMATGTRTTTVIPVGAIGNEQPITIVSEEWFSPELKVLVMTRHVDPRSGETTYRLTGIVRGEPNPSLFDLPAGVIVK